MKNKTVKTWIQENAQKYSNNEDLILECQKSLNVTRKAVLNKIRNHFLTEKLSLNSKQKSKTKINGMTIDEFRRYLDPIYRLREEVKKIPADKIYPENEFRTHIVQLDSNRFKLKASLPEFDLYKGKANSKIFWSNPKTIAQLKEEGLMS